MHSGLIIFSPYVNFDVIVICYEINVRNPCVACLQGLIACTCLFSDLLLVILQRDEVTFIWHSEV